MRNKIKEIMNKEEGFTLVELLAVIVILGIIVAIAVPMIGNVVGDSQDQADQAEVELIEDAARLYYISNDDKIPSSGSTTIDTEELEEAGFLELRNSNTTGTVTVTVTDDGGLTYKFNKN